MGGKMARSKGQRGEREVAKLLQPVVNEVYVAAGFAPPLFKRNLMQSREGGYDIVGLDWLALEVKRQETLNVNTWWKQTIEQAGEKQTPVLIYRKNHGKWRVMMYGVLLCNFRDIDGMSVPVDISFDSFLKYFKMRIEYEIS